MAADCHRHGVLAQRRAAAKSPCASATSTIGLIATILSPPVARNRSAALVQVVTAVLPAGPARSAMR